MAGSAGSIYIDLLLNDARYKDGLSKAGNYAKGFGKTASTAILAATAATTALAAAVSSIAIGRFPEINKIGELARNAGFATEEFQSLSKALNVSNDELLSFISQSQKSTISAASGVKRYSDAFSRIGLDAKELINLKPEEQFDKISTALSQVSNTALRNSSAMTILGNSVKDNISSFDNLSSNIQKAREFQEKFGIALSNLDTLKVKEASDAMSDVREAIGGLFNQLSVNLAPVITHIANLFLTSGITAESFGNVVSKAANIAAVGLDVLRRAILGVNITFESLVFTIGDLTGRLSLSLYDLGQGIANTLNMIPGVSIEAEDSLLKIGLSARNMADDAAQGIRDTIDELNNFESTSKRVADIQEQANKRLDGKNNGLPSTNISVENLSKSTQSIEKWLVKQREALETLRQEADYIGKTKIEIDLLKDAREFEAQVAGRAYGLKGRELERFREQAEAIKNLRQEIIQYNYESSRTAQAAFEEFSAKYQEDATNMAKNIQGVLENAFKGAEDAFVEFTKTGKINFKDLANSIIEDLIRIQFKNSVSGLLGGLGGGGGGGGLFGSLLSGIGGLFGGGGGVPASQVGIARTASIGPSSAGFGTGIKFFADGGYLGPGQFGIAGEAGAELIYGGKTGVSVFNQDQIGSKGNVYQIDARGADQGAVMRIEQSLLALAGPGVIEKRVSNAQMRGDL